MGLFLACPLRIFLFLLAHPCRRRHSRRRDGRERIAEVCAPAFELNAIRQAADLAPDYSPDCAFNARPSLARHASVAWFRCHRRPPG